MVSSPVPQGLYRAATAHGDFVFTAGMTPRVDGTLLYRGAIGGEVSLDDARAAAALAARNAADAAEQATAPPRTIERCLRMTVYLVCAPGFEGHSSIADAASSHIAERFGAESLGARTTVGVASLPGGSPVEVELIMLTVGAG